MQSLWMVPASFIVGANFGFFAPQAGLVFTNDVATVENDTKISMDEVNTSSLLGGSSWSNLSSQANDPHAHRHAAFFSVPDLTLRESLVDLPFHITLFVFENFLSHMWSVEHVSIIPDDVVDMFASAVANASSASLEMLPGVVAISEDLASMLTNTSRWNDTVDHAKVFTMKFKDRFPRYVIDADQAWSTICLFAVLCLISFCELLGLWKAVCFVSRFCPCRLRRSCPKAEDMAFIFKLSDESQCKLNFKGGQKLELSHGRVTYEGTLLDTRIRLRKGSVSILQARTLWARFQNCLQF